MKKIILSLSMLAAVGVYAQTGINTTAPKATLDIIAKNTDGSTPEGVKTPQLIGDAVKAMTANLGADQNGMLVYVTTPVTTTDATTTNVIFPGYYRFNLDSSVTPAVKSWVRLEPSGLEKIKIANNYGWRYIGSNPASYGGIGNGATDLSYVPAASEEGRYLDYQFASPDGMQQVTYGLIKNAVLGGYYQGYSFQNNSISMNNLGAIGHNSFATGLYNSASGIGSVALGVGNNAMSDIGSVAAGFANTSKFTSVVMGMDNYGDYNSTAIGTFSKATSRSITLGNDNTADNESMALGFQSTAKEGRAIAIGFYSNAKAPYSMALHRGITTAQGAFAAGSSSAEGESSFAIGNQLKTLVHNETAMGIFNTYQNRGDISLSPYMPSNQRLFTIGNGTLPNGNVVAVNSSDAFTILKNAKAGIGIDYFENTASDAKLQVNGKVLIGDFGDNSTNNNTISTAPSSDASLNVLGEIKVGNKNITCNAANEGSIKYVKTSGVGNFEGCRDNNGTFQWIKINP